jgi:hypothetical protein
MYSCIAIKDWEKLDCEIQDHAKLKVVKADVVLDNGVPAAIISPLECGVLLRIFRSGVCSSLHPPQRIPRQYKTCKHSVVV